MFTNYLFSFRPIIAVEKQHLLQYLFSFVFHIYPHVYVFSDIFFLKIFHNIFCLRFVYFPFKQLIEGNTHTCSNIISIDKYLLYNIMTSSNLLLKQKVFRYPYNRKICYLDITRKIHVLQILVYISCCTSF